MTEQERAVWQRVTAGREQPAPGVLGLTDLLRRESENAAAYLALAKQYGAPRRQHLLRMAEDARHHCHILQGMLKK